jgi:hypothetical protein
MCAASIHVEQPQKSLAAHAGGRYARPIPWGDLLIPHARLYKAPTVLDLRVTDYQEAPALPISATRGTDTRL